MRVRVTGVWLSACMCVWRESSQHTTALTSTHYRPTRPPPPLAHQCALNSSSRHRYMAEVTDARAHAQRVGQADTDSHPRTLSITCTSSHPATHHTAYEFVQERMKIFHRYLLQLSSPSLRFRSDGSPRFARTHTHTPDHYCHAARIPTQFALTRTAHSLPFAVLPSTWVPRPALYPHTGHTSCSPQPNHTLQSDTVFTCAPTYLPKHTPTQRVRF